MAETSIAADLQEFIMEQFMTGSAVEHISPDEDLLAAGIVDSHGLLQLVAFLDEHCGVTVGDHELTPENFQTIAAIDAFVQRERTRV